MIITNICFKRRKVYFEKEGVKIVFYFIGDSSSDELTSVNIYAELAGNPLSHYPEEWEHEAASLIGLKLGELDHTVRPIL